MARNLPIPPSKEERGGLSRKASRTLERERRRGHSDDILDSLFGSPSEHFRQNPLDGPTIIGAMPVPGGTAGPQGPPVQPVSADDSVADVAKWFAGTGREGAKTSPPESAKTKIPKPMSLAAAAEAATVGTAIDQAMRVEFPTGLPGERDLESVLDDVERPPNTY